jgi:CRISPR-associated endonuclease/helicase Cas3
LDAEATGDGWEWWSVDSDVLSSDADVIDLRVWGKARGLGDLRYPLACHLLDAGAAGRLLWDRYVPPGVRRVISEGLGVSETHAGALVALWAAVHDIGKITPQFQSSAQDAHLPGYPSGHGQLRHDEAAHKWLQAMLPRLGYAGGDQSSPSFVLAQLIGGHHGKFYAAMHNVRPGAPLSCFGFAADEWQEQREASFRIINGILGSPEPPPDLDLAAAVLVCAIVILADWLVSQEPYLKRRFCELPQSGTATELRAHFERSLVTVQDLLIEAGLGTLALKPGSFRALFPQITVPNALQCSISDLLPGLATGPGLLLITAPPGLGKTETGLYAAHVMGRATGRPGLYMALPTTATADQMFLRVRDFARDNACGDAPLTLLHSMAWLNTQYIGEVPAAGEVLSGDDHVADPFAPTDWLLGRRRGICAPWAVGTVDQALMAVLKSRYNVLRMFGLAGKTVVVDEVHACDPYMQGLLRQLLRWLGNLGTPVVLLSATVTTASARALISAYLEGAHGRRWAGKLAERAVVHPAGWVYASLDGRITPVEIDLPERLPLRVEIREIGRVPARDGKVVPDRQAVLGAELSALVAEGGCALVICTTVAEAQQTFTQLRSWFAGLTASGVSPPELNLLHSRFPAWQRAEITERVIDRFGKKGHRYGNRPHAAVLVATAIVEQSLDLDFDLIVSDLAPVALLLQRAGRCWRHEDLKVITRPSWASGPRLIVLVPPGGPDKPELLRSWQAIYDESLLAGTYKLLAQRDTIRIPADVQGLVDDVYTDPALAEGILVTRRLGTELAQEQLANLVAIEAPRNLSSLYELTEIDVDPELLATRFGADSIRVLPVFADDSGEAWLDADCSIRVPGANGVRPSRQECRTVIERAIPVRGGLWYRTWRERPESGSEPLASWTKISHLRDLVLLVHRVRGDGMVDPASAGGRGFLLDQVLGLVSS